MINLKLLIDYQPIIIGDKTYYADIDRTILQSIVTKIYEDFEGAKNLPPEQLKNILEDRLNYFGIVLYDNNEIFWQENEIFD
jgi:hypothetical protein